MTILPFPEHSTPLEDIVEQVYAETCSLEPFAFQLGLNLQSQTLTEQEVQRHIKMGGSEKEARRLKRVPQVSPSRTTLEKWQADVRANVETLRRLGK